MRALFWKAFLLTATLALPANAQIPSSQDHIDTLVTRLQAQSADIEKMKTTGTFCQALVIEIDRTICVEKGTQSGLTASEAFIQSVSAAEHEAICELFENEEKAQCSKETSPRAAFLFASRAICRGCVSPSGTLADLKIAKSAHGLKEIDAIGVMVKEARAELDQMHADLTAGRAGLAAQAASARAVAEQVMKITTCRSTATALVIQNKPAPKKPVLGKHS